MCSLDGHNNRVTDVLFLPDSKRIVTTAFGKGESTIIWNAENGKEIHKLDSGATMLNLVSLNLAANEAPRIMLADDDQLLIYDADTGQKLESKTWSEETTDKLAALTEDAETIVGFSYQQIQRGEASLEFRSKAQNGRSYFYGFKEQPTKVAVSAQDYWLSACARNDQTVYLWQTDKPQETIRLEGHNEPVQSVAFSDDERWLISVSWDHQVKIWEAVSGRLVTSLAGHSEHVCSVAVSPDMRWLATGASGETDCSVILWDLRKALFDQPEFASSESSMDFVQAWDRLGAREPKSAYEAVHFLLRRPAGAIEFLQKELLSYVSVVEPAEIPTLIEKLDNDDFDVREAAQRRLLSVRDQSAKFLTEALKNERLSAESRYRIEEILTTKNYRPQISMNERLTMHRAVLVLELIGEEAAQEMLRRITVGYSDDRIKFEAKLALQRVAK